MEQESEQGLDLETIKKEQIVPILREKQNDELLALMTTYRDLHNMLEKEIKAMRNGLSMQSTNRDEAEQAAQHHRELLRKLDRVDDIHISAFGVLTSRGCFIQWSSDEHKFIIISEGNPRSPEMVIEEINRMLTTYKQELPEKEHKREFALTALSSASSMLLECFASLSSLSLEERRGLVIMRKLFGELFEAMH